MEAIRSNRIKQQRGEIMSSGDWKNRPKQEAGVSYPGPSLRKHRKDSQRKR